MALIPDRYINDFNKLEESYSEELSLNEYISKLETDLSMILKYDLGVFFTIDFIYETYKANLIINKIISLR